MWAYTIIQINWYPPLSIGLKSSLMGLPNEVKVVRVEISFEIKIVNSHIILLFILVFLIIF